MELFRGERRKTFGRVNGSWSNVSIVKGCFVTRNKDGTQLTIVKNDIMLGTVIKDDAGKYTVKDEEGNILFHTHTLDRAVEKLSAASRF